MTKMAAVAACVVSPRPERVERIRAEMASHPECRVDLAYGTCDQETLLLNLHRHQIDCFILDTDLGAEVVTALNEQLQQVGYRHFVYLGQPLCGVALSGEFVMHSAPAASVLSAVVRTAAPTRIVPGPQQNQATGDRRGMLLSVHSPKGGTGKSLLACSLAVQFAAKGVRTLLVDLALYGGIGPSLGLPRREKGLEGVLAGLERDQTLLSMPGLADLLRGNLRHYPAGEHTLDLLTAGPPMKMAALTLEQTEAILRWLACERYEVIIVDTSSEIAERNAVVLKSADCVLLPVTPEVGAAWALLAIQDLLRNLEGTGKLRVVVNRALPGLPVHELEAAIGYPVIAQIPESPHPWERAVGRNLRFDYSALGMALKRLAQYVLPVYSPVEIPSIRR